MPVEPVSSTIPTVPPEERALSTRLNIVAYLDSEGGLGHQRRLSTLLRALVALQPPARVTLLCGDRAPGFTAEVAGVEVVRLPPRPIGFVAPAARPSAAEAERERGRVLGEVLRRVKPNVFLVELFPFGRRQLREELLAAMAAARELSPGCQVVCSTREATDPNAAPGRLVQEDLGAFDAVLVHGDPAVHRLEEQLELSPPVPFSYTGYVCAAAEAPPVVAAPPARPTVVASVGGGEDGLELLRAVIGAAERLAAEPATTIAFELFTGPLMPAEAVATLERLAADLPGVDLQRFTPDLPERLGRAALAISMAGYNTVVDLLALRVPCILIPRSSNDEQLIRARRLERIDGLRVIAPAALTAERLSHAIRAGLAGPRLTHDVDLRGAASSARLLAALVERSYSARPG